ncbi:MAG: DNA ligase D, partial [bacterium]
LFVIQKHEARRLHFDLRLELDGVLKSWAVTRGPSLDPSEKRLAVRTEDHPVDYAGFEGRIPEGYGAGTVLLWDRGEWRPRGDPREGLRNGVLKFELEGERLKGGFALIRMKRRGREKREHWLLVKERDPHADEEADPVAHWRRSIKTGRDLAAISRGGEAYDEGRAYPVNAGDERLGGKDAPKSGRTRKEAPLPAFVPPQLATLRDRPPAGEEWLHEVKFDGYRIQALVADGKVRLMSRNRKDWTEHYPALARALERLDVHSAVIDGELIAVDGHGGGDFGKLQQAAGKSGAPLLYYAFDLLYLDGEDLHQERLADRKRRLNRILDRVGDPVRYCDHIQGSGRRVIEQACGMNLEGIISKNANSPYRSGRGTAWIKVKCINRDEFVIGGYRKSGKRGRPFASLLLGEYSGERLVYRGRVGTGFSERTMDRLASRMKPLERESTPFQDPPRDARKDAVWLEPELVAQIGYWELTADGHLRHPVFLGLREDKPAPEVTEAGRRQEREPGTGALHGVRLTNPDRVLYPEQGATKRQLAEYYSDHARLVLRYLGGRPLSLVRCPEGRGGECFFQKHHTASTPEQIKTVMVAEREGEKAPYLLIDSAAGLVAAAQIGALELHIWGARAERIEQPDRLVFDLDPDESLSFAHVREAAAELRDVLEAANFASFPLLTGGKGIHVVVPLEPRRGWADVKAFSRGLAGKLAEASPRRYVARMSKARRKGKIFIDWMRNERGSTAIAPWSTRARHGAPLAMPVSWEELARTESAAAWTLSDTAALRARLETDPWEGYHRLRQPITGAHMKFAV